MGQTSRQTRVGQDRRQALVEAAYRRIAECGFEGLRLRDVAAEVGIDHSTIHHYPGAGVLIHPGQQVQAHRGHRRPGTAGSGRSGPRSHR